ncbi:MAG TPA: ArsC/Spx/MgsR family protein [Ilumatobacter sp.]|nr:ArsC/Spx/MgsR family protein [Ilumatobacter sp.]
MADVTIFHNPDCSTSRYAVDTVAELGVDADIVIYRKTPPDAAALRGIIAKLDVDEPTDLVRRDALFAKLGLADADVATVDQVVDTLVEHKMLLQRPLLVTPKRAFIGRPKDRVRDEFS